MADEGFKRKLAAILSADVEGYSRLMDDDEEATVRTLTSYRNAITDLTQQFRGRVVDSPGDNILAEFSSVVDAVNCAVEIQRELAERNAELPDNRKMEFRIGVNLGDVIEEDGRIYGDGVNIAARVESMAVAGGICISGRAYDQVSNKLGLEYENLGEHQLKNISTPIRVYRVLSFPGAAAHRVIQAKHTFKKKLLWVAASTILILLIIFIGLYWKYYYLPAPAEIDPEGKITFELSRGPSIAVLPFVNMSKDPEQDYFCDGITENIIAALAHTPKLFVIARDAVFSYKGKTVDLQEVGRELGVRYVIEGSVQLSENRMRITVQLVDTDRGIHLWAERFDRSTEEIFALQDEIAVEIMKALQVKLTKGEQIRNRFEGTSDLKVFTHLLKSLDYFHRANIESSALSRKEAQAAISLDPDNASAYVLLGVSYIQSLYFGSCDPVILCFGRATEAVRKALSLDKNNSDAALLASQIYVMRKEHDRAIAEAMRGVSLNPNSAEAYAVLGYTLHLSGRSEEGIEFVKKALRLNPVPHSIYLQFLGHTYRGTRQYEKAVQAYQQSIKCQPDHIFSYIGLAATYSLMGDQVKANQSGREVLRINPGFSLEKFAKIVSMKDKSVKERYIQALRDAGLK
jgi:adenylate cyclase